MNTAKKPKPAPVHYLVTGVDGIIPRSAEAGFPTDIAAALGTTIDHPNPGRRWYDDTAFSYFRTVSAPAEVLDDAPGLAAWRLWEVQPLGTTGNWNENGRRDDRWRLYAHQLQVVREVDAHLALGPRGRQVRDLLDQELPGLARRWAATYQADPARVDNAHRTWRLCTFVEPAAARGDDAHTHAAYHSRNTRRTAALLRAEHLAIKAALAATEEEFGRSAAHYAAMRAESLADAVLMEDRLSEYVLNSLRGLYLEQFTPAGV
ncbi:hypothetical protein GCM10009759_71080 [Kitasatospora saccharophila]|uniref:Uncharacterized protein n=1 Tax=Kitasatospora saccharophila TaxID=407973 RepID=A0ABP5JSQ8_9ACTN